MKWLSTVPNGGIAQFLPGGCYLVNGQVLVSYRTGLTIDGNGSTFKRAVFVPGASIWRFNGGSNLSVQSMKILGTDPTDAYNDTKTREQAVAVAGVQGFTVSNVTASQVWGDCVIVTHDDGNSQVPARGVLIQGLTCDAGRQGISLIVGSNITIRGSTFLGAHYNAIDLEPNIKSEALSGVVIDGNTFDHPTWEVGGDMAVGGCLTTNVQITNNRDRNVPHAANPIWIAAWSGCSSSGITVSGNRWLLTAYNNYRAPVESTNWTYVYVKNNTFVANYKYAFGYTLNLHNADHVWYSGNTVTGPYADKWKKVKADGQSSDVHVS